MIIAYSAALVTTLLTGTPVFVDTQTQPVTLIHDDVIVTVEEVHTSEDLQKGLSNRSLLLDNHGMLFTFSEDGPQAMWMKDMLFSLDILWLDVSGKVVHIEPWVHPETYPEAFSSPLPARYVLEVPAGFVQRHDLVLNDMFTWG